MEQARQRAAIYVRGNRVLTYPEVRTEAGFFVADEPYTNVSRLEPAELGHAVSDALKASDREIPAPSRSEWAARNATRFLAAGVKSEAAFMRGARLIIVERQGETLEVVPNQNAGATGAGRGFGELREHALRLTAPTDHAALGSACLEVLQQCR